ncbi:MAG: NUDIX domain-containing protein [Oscillospiraceae bacterium]
MNNKYYTVCGIFEIDEKILLVRHTYGTAKDRILLPGGYVGEDELPTKAVEREIFEETSVVAKVKSVFSIQFQPKQWCVIFIMNYISGTPKSDEYENSEVLLENVYDAVVREDITNLSREILKAYSDNKNNVLEKSNYIKKSSTKNDYIIFGI